MSPNHVEVARKALAYAIFCDIIRGSITAVGSVNTADSGKTAAVIVDEVQKAVTNKHS